jgi:hypothetical protein
MFRTRNSKSGTSLGLTHGEKEERPFQTHSADVQQLL